jgi:hypothetical protein
MNYFNWISIGLKKTILLSFLFFVGLSFSVYPVPAFAGHPDLEKIFQDLPLLGDEENPYLFRDILDEPSLLTPEVGTRLKQTLQAQLIKAGFSYLSTHQLEDYGLNLNYAQLDPPMITSIDFFNSSSPLPINIRINSDGSVYLKSCYVGKKTLDVFKSMHFHLETYKLVPYINKKTLLEAEDHAFITSLDLQSFNITGVHTEADGSESLELSYRVIPGFELEMRLQSNGILTVYGSHHWISGTKSKLSHCRSRANFIHLAFSGP